MTKTTTDITAAPATSSLPSPHLDHSAVLMAELDQRLLGFDTGISAIHAEVSGMQIAFDQETAELEQADKDRRQKHADKIKDKARLTADLERARGMVLAGKAAYSAELPPVNAAEASNSEEAA